MSQTITPELRAWIVQQAQAGCTPQSVLAAMRRAGWDEDVALTAMEEVLQAHLATLPMTTSLPRPHLALDGGPRALDAGDRVVQVIATLRRPRLAVLANVLSHEECEALIALAAPRLQRSRTVQTSTGGEELNPDRTSDGMFFRRGETPLIERIEARLSRLLHWPVEHGEGLQVLRYRAGAQYKPHYDYFDPQAAGTARLTARGGQRVATVVIYLNEPERGGGTTFPDVGLEVLPQRGSAVFFAYDQPDPATLTLHGGAPVLEGEKWVATKWLRERPFTP
ncbi:2OG-Fe(II) oxygenase superfamily protein [Tepidimonas alkaliphilus]|uniref:2OG-Fe(II) oxygenase superfamily protein n=1 Tax=Tepidimonas alkaliphilus TaxID=2588942 RepID=A0A554W6U3_9BURK|nr:2OG-Fe(II) oxygenase [Tepidimonas alkaliphilus]TSE19282.1 2OG-Fe(II) oxygenase superfamily protein [Tepidimonas alkaliphilus]